MEINLHMQRPLSCRRVTDSSKSHLKIKQFLGFYPHGRTNLYLQSYSGSEDHMVAVVSNPIFASAEFSRRRPRNISTSTSKSSAPKGFMPKPQVGMGQRKDKKNYKEKEAPDTTVSKEFGDSVRNTFETERDLNDEEDIKVRQGKVEEESEDKTNGIMEKISSARTPSPLAQINYLAEHGDNSQIGTDSLGLKEPSRMLRTNTEADGGRTSSGGKDAIKGYAYKQNDANKIEQEMVTASTDSAGKQMKFARSNEAIQDENNESKQKETPILEKGADIAAMEARQGREQIEVIKRNDLEQDNSKKISSDGSKNHVLPDSVEVSIAHKEKQDEVVKLKLEMETTLRKQALGRLANQSLLEGSKLFCYPEVVKSDEDMEIFLNRSLSTLNNEPDVFIMGAFNDWRWRSFTIKLKKTNLSGDWWSCQVHVPKEAYKLDFVFFNGKDVYDNNDRKDFCINVDGCMDAFEFEDFLLEEKRVELERQAKELAERKRQEEEQRRIEAEQAASEADRAQAREETAKRKRMLQELMKAARASVDNVWYTEPSDFKSEDEVRLFYNRSSGPLLHSTDLWLHGGYNNWTDGLSIVEKLVRVERKDGDWWYADVIVPARALVLDWVFADGPPQKAIFYDNNSFQDFHSVIPNCIPEEMYWVEEERNVYRKLQEERRLREEAMLAKAERTAELKTKTKEKTLKAFLLSQKHIVYTEPLDVQAGKSVTVYYNSANTVLNGKSEIWFRCLFNRWTHRLGPLPPQRMLPAENGSHVKTTVKVPLDAYMMDFVFSEREDGGIFDNKNGMDYHIPVSRGVTREPPMHIVHIAVEMAPIAKVGGLGDVVTSLSRAVQDMNHNVDIILPKYDCLNLSSVKDFHYQKSFSWDGTEIKVWFGNVEGLSVYFLEPQNGYFWMGRVYGCRNDGERFGFFCHAGLEFLRQSGFHPDIIHCHDWSSAPVAWLFKEHYRHYGLSKARVVFTIHNLEFGAGNIGRAMTYSDKATTVSPTYSQEVSGNPVIAPHLYKFHGILNGIDPDIWDPFNDKYIPISYTSENAVEGKRAAKEALQQRLGLKRADKPLVGIVTRLTHQKGIHLIKHAIWRTLDRNGQVVLLGSAPDPRIQNDFVNLANQLHSSHNDSARLCLTYDEPLSHLIYAGADFILVPSIFEPCGLTQLIAMRYGSIPVVRKTGGLYDTVFDVDHDKERARACGLETNGFSFDGADAAGVDYALNRAISAWYNDRGWFNSLCNRVMEQDWSWNRPALDYLELYHAARK